MKNLFIIPGECVPKKRPKFSTHKNFVRTYTPAETANYENFVKICFMNDDNCKKIESKVAIEAIIEIHRKIPKSASKKRQQAMLENEIKPTTKPDIDNCAKSILDALNGIAYDDDGQIAKLEVTKIYDNEDYTKVWLKEI